MSEVREWEIVTYDQNHLVIENKKSSKTESVAYINGNQAKEIAYLICAAPDLLAACEQALEALKLDAVVDSNGNFFGTTEVSEVALEALEALEQAIAKAKGEKI